MEISSDDLSKFKSFSSISDPFRRQLAICSMITSFFEKNGLHPPIIVGGTVVSLYSGGLYKTVDLDLKSESVEEYKEIMRLLGYQKVGKDFYQGNLESYVEFPSGRMEDSLDKVRKVTIEETDLPVYLIGIEDIILDRMNGWVATKDHNAREWSIRLMAALYPEIDWSYLHRRASNLGSLKEVEKAQREVKRYKKMYEQMQSDETSSASEVLTIKFTTNSNSVDKDTGNNE